MVKKRSRNGVRVVIVLLAAFMLVLGIESALAHDNDGYSHDSDIGYTNKDWMGDLPNDILLSHMSLPGTHDTMAYKLSDSCDLIVDIAKTQTMNLGKQLDSGIRVLDIRARHIDDTFTMHHGVCYLESNFDDVLGTVTDFLDDNPTEVVFMKIKEEHTAENTTQSFEDTFLDYYNDSDYNAYFWDEGGDQYANPRLGDIRGKIVILQDFGGSVYGLNWDSFNGEDCPDFDGDCWEFDDNWDLYPKWENVKAHLKEVDKGDLNTIYHVGLNGSKSNGIVLPYFVASGHSSPGTGAPRLSTGSLEGPTYNKNKWPDFPRTACFLGTCTISFEGTNILTKNFIKDGKVKTRVGIVTADFPGKGLIKQIINLNDNFTLPTADAGGPYTANEGTAITFDASGSSDSGGNALEYRWDFDSDGTYDTSFSTSATATNTWHDDYSGTATVEVSNGTFEATATASVTVSNVAPAATAGGGTIDENGTATVSGTITDPSNLDTFDVVIDWGEGSPETFSYPAGSTSYSETHQYLDDNPTGTASDDYAIGVTVTDDDGDSGTAATTVTVNNVDPALALSGDVIEIDENGTATVSGTISDVGTQDSYELVFDWGEGSPVAYNYAAGTTSFSESHQYLDDNPTGTPSDVYAIGVTLTDDDGGSVSDSTSAMVNNVAPILALSGDTIDENGTATVSGTITDPGTQDTFTVVIDWGEGSPVTYSYGAGTTSFNETHQYLDDNPTGTPSDVYTISGSITDDDTGTGSASTTVTVNNVAPILALSGNTIDENGTATVSGTITDPGTLDTFEVVIDWGEGSPVTYSYGAGTTSFSEAHQYLDDNPTGTPSDVYTINGSITDDDSGTGSASTTVTVNNVNPVTSIDSITDETGEAVGTGVRVVLMHTEIDLLASFTDVGTQDTHTANIDWGDGSSDYLGSTTGSIATSHVYTTPGEYTVLLEVTDDDTGVGPATVSITVVDAADAMAIILDELKALAADPNLDPAAVDAINDAIAQLEGQNGGGAEGGALDMLAKGNLNAALVKIWQAMQSLEAAEAAEPSLDLTSSKSLLALTAKSAAMTAIVEADAAATKRNEMLKVDDAYDLIDDADALLAAYNYVGAVDKYREAAQEVQGIVK